MLYFTRLVAVVSTQHIVSLLAAFGAVFISNIDLLSYVSLSDHYTLLSCYRNRACFLYCIGVQLLRWNGSTCHHSLPACNQGNHILGCMQEPSTQHIDCLVVLPPVFLFSGSSITAIRGAGHTTRHMPAMDLASMWKCNNFSYICLN